MKGFIFIILIYCLTILILSLSKYFKNSILKNKNESESTTPKIYYITNYIKKKKPIKKVSTDIAIKGTILDKENVIEKEN